MKKTLITILISVFSCAVVAVGAFAAYSLMNSNKNDNTQVTTEAGGSSNLVISADSRSSADSISQKVQDGMIVVKMTGTWTFGKNCTESNAYIANSDKNHYPMKFVVTLSDTGEKILETPEVPIGSCIEKFGLTKPLSEGTHEAVVSHQAVKDGQVVSEVNTSLTIVVK